MADDEHGVRGAGAIVTGGGRGVGRGVALALARAGVNVALAELDPDTARATAAELEALGVRALGLPCDVSRRDQIDAAVAETAATFGRIDILVNNAVWNTSDVPAKSFEAHTDADFDHHLAVGLMGTVYGMQACLPHLRQRGGRIVNVASSAGTERMAGFAAYAATKEAIRAVTGVAAREWGPLGIRVNVICPWALTPSTEGFYRDRPKAYERAVRSIPAGRIGDPETDIGRAVVFLASPASDFITGQTIWVDGGATIHA